MVRAALQSQAPGIELCAQLDHGIGGVRIADEVQEAVVLAGDAAGDRIAIPVAVAGARDDEEAGVGRVGEPHGGHAAAGGIARGTRTAAIAAEAHGRFHAGHHAFGHVAAGAAESGLRRQHDFVAGQHVALDRVVVGAHRTRDAETREARAGAGEGDRGASARDEAVLAALVRGVGGGEPGEDLVRGFAREQGLADLAAVAALGVDRGLRGARAVADDHDGQVYRKVEVGDAGG
ncbi:MAG: hypothetical protein R3E96_02270 [Planctomycetota bacterium]